MTSIGRKSNMSSFPKVDAIYRSAIEAPGRELAAAFAAARQIPVDLYGEDLTVAVLLRLRSFYLTQDLIKTELRKVYAAAASDFFVETAAFFLKVSLEKLAPGVEVMCEKGIIPKAGSMRPDISLWREGKVIAAVECKTQLVGPAELI